MEATLDGTAVSLPFTAAPYALPMGEHKITIRAADLAGNVTAQDYVLKVMMDRDHLDEALHTAYEQGLISNQGVLNSLLAKVNRIQNERDEHKIINALNALENELSAQSGKHVDVKLAQHLLSDLAYLKKAASSQP